MLKCETLRSNRFLYMETTPQPQELSEHRQAMHELEVQNWERLSEAYQEPMAQLKDKAHELELSYALRPKDQVENHRLNTDRISVLRETVTVDPELAELKQQAKEREEDAKNELLTSDEREKLSKHIEDLKKQAEELTASAPVRKQERVDNFRQELKKEAIDQLLDEAIDHAYEVDLGPEEAVKKTPEIDQEAADKLREQQRIEDLNENALPALAKNIIELGVLADNEKDDSVRAKHIEKLQKANDQFSNKFAEVNSYFNWDKDTAQKRLQDLLTPTPSPKASAAAPKKTATASAPKASAPVAKTAVTPTPKLVPAKPKPKSRRERLKAWLDSARSM